MVTAMATKQNALRSLRVLRNSAPVRPLCHRKYSAPAYQESQQESRLPRVASPSFWKSLVPRPFRKPTTLEEAEERNRSREAGHAERRVGLSFLILGIVVGSNAIQLISLRRERLNFTRQTEARLELLREVIKKVQSGEKIDIKRALGTGNEQDEKEWEDMIKELETTDMLWESKQKRDAARAEAAKTPKPARARERKEPESSSEQTPASAGETSSKKSKFLM